MTRVSVLIVAALAVSSSAWAADTPKSGSFKTSSAFRGTEQSMQVGGRVMSSGVTYGILTSEDNPLRIKTANCPYISQIDGDTITMTGECAWTDGQDNIFTEWNTKFSASKGSMSGTQNITGGSGKYSNISGSNPFECQVVGKEGQLTCTQNWNYQIK